MGKFSFSRRKFILASSGIVSATTLFSAPHRTLATGSAGWRARAPHESSSSGSPLYNVDVQTAIGLGDELASMVD